eukprot:203213_1
MKNAVQTSNSKSHIMSQDHEDDISIIVSMTCIALVAIIFAWWLYAFKTDKLCMDAIQPTQDHETLAFSPYMSRTMLAIIRCFVGCLSFTVMLYNILCVYLPSDIPTLLCSYHVWCWISMILYFLILSWSTLCHCLSPSKTNIFYSLLRLIIWILYQIQLSISFTLLVFMWLYIYLNANQESNSYLYHFTDITMVSCNFLFIWSDFFVNAIPLRFHFGLTVLLVATLYLLFIWTVTVIPLPHIQIYPFLEPTHSVHAIWFVVWSATHVVAWTVVYCIAFAKIKYQKKHIEADVDKKKRWRINNGHKYHQSAQIVDSDPIDVATHKPDGSNSTRSRTISKRKYMPVTVVLSVPDLMTPHPTRPSEDDEDDDELSPLHPHRHDAAVENPFMISLKPIDTINTVSTDLSSLEVYAPRASTQHHRPVQSRMSGDRRKQLQLLKVQSSKSNRSFHERMNSVRILAGVEDTLSQRHSTAELKKNYGKKARIEEELLTTEATYLKGLHILLEEFIGEIFARRLMDPQYETTVRCNIPQLIAFHEEFWSDLDSKGSIAKVFNEKADFLKMYIEYIGKYETILDIFARCKNKNAKLEEFLNEKRAENKPLTNYLILPIQRIPRYMLLLSELKKHTPPSSFNDVRDIASALDKVTNICSTINEKQKEIENMSQCLQITETLTALNFNIVEPHRKYIAHFIFRRANDSRNRQFFVFNDIVIIANTKWETKRVIKLQKFKAKKVCFEQLSIRIEGDATGNRNYDGSVVYEKTDDIAAKDRHVDVSNVDMFCEMINKCRVRLYKRTMSRMQLNQRDFNLTNNSQSNSIATDSTLPHDISLEMIELIREQQNEEKLNNYQQSKESKGKKEKVMQILRGGPSVSAND